METCKLLMERKLSKSESELAVTSHKFKYLLLFSLQIFENIQVSSNFQKLHKFELFGLKRLLKLAYESAFPCKAFPKRPPSKKTSANAHFRLNIFHF